VIIHLENNLPYDVQNGTSLHIHGLRQYYTNPMDGVVSVTQCPIAPGHTMTYRWRATQYGTTWYHSHIGLQTWEGAYGGVIINGPASKNYDEDKGVILLSDWDINTVDQMWDQAEAVGSPSLDNALINGVNVFGDDDQTGYRFNTSFAPGKSYRLRVTNVACDTLFKFSIDHHTMKVIAMDFVPIQPYTTTFINVAVGKRF
jgi:FtsP/CotA-like multicopper oxidase with cupredoxin domain